MLASAVRVSSRQEAHKHVHKCGVRHHLLGCALLHTHPTAGGWRCNTHNISTVNLKVGHQTVCFYNQAEAGQHDTEIC